MSGRTRAQQARHRQRRRRQLLAAGIVLVLVLVVIELGKGSRELAPGESQTLDLSEESAGTYAVVCDLTGHREEGMETTLVLS